ERPSCQARRLRVQQAVASVGHGGHAATVGRPGLGHGLPGRAGPPGAAPAARILGPVDPARRLRAATGRGGRGSRLRRRGGGPGLNLDLNQEVQRKLLPVVGLVLVLSFLVLMVFFRSLLLPLKAVLVNLLSVLAVYGVLVFIFQEGHFQGPLAFQSNGHIESFLPLFLFSILFGLSMAYEVFLL